MDSFWNVANAVRDAVKQQTADLAASLQNTDWKNELTGLQDGLKEESVEITQKAKEVTEELSHRSIEVAKTLPQVIDEGRRKAAAQLEHLPGTSAVKVQEAAAQLQQAGASLTKIGQRVVNNTTEMLDHFSSAIQAEMNANQEMGRSYSGTAPRSQNPAEASKFIRLDADVAAMQRDSSTYCDEPEDEEEFAVWCNSFDLPGMKPDIAKLLSENTFMSELQARIVPVVVDYESFWTRYYYRLHKLEERHAKVTALAMRAEAGVNEDEVGWDMDDDDDEEEEKEESTVVSKHAAPSAPKDAEKKSGKQTAAAAVVAAAALGAVTLDSSAEEESSPLGEPSASAEVVTEEESVEVVDQAENENDLPQETGAAAAMSKEQNESKKDDKKADGDFDDDDLSSLDLSGADDLGDDGDDTGSDWGEVAEWE